MNKNEIIKMANDAELCQTIWIDDEGTEIASLVDFANLVAAKERDEILKLCEPSEHSHQFVHTFKKVIKARGNV